jgi:hypothetical protein
MNILRRWLRETKEADQDVASQPAMNQRIQVTVERETITLLVRGPQTRDQQAPTAEIAAEEILRLEPPPLDEELPEKNCTKNTPLRPLPQLDRRVLQDGPGPVS